MPDFSMFGPLANGGRVYEQDQANNSVRALNEISTISQIQEREQLQQTQRQEMQERALRIQKQRQDMERENALRLKMSQIASRQPQQTPDPSVNPGTNTVRPNGGKPQAASSRMADIGMQLWQGGFTEGLDVLGKADELYTKESTAAKENALKDKAITEDQVKQLGIVAGVYRGVNSPSTKAAADQALMIAFQGKVPPEYQSLMKAPYDKRLIDAIETGATSKKDQSLIDYRKRMTELTGAVDNAKIKLMKSATDVNESRNKFIQEKTTADAKQGKIVNAPKPKEIENAEKYALEKLGLKDKNELDETSRKSFEDASRYLASAGLEYRTSKRGVGERQSFDKMYDPTDWKMLQKKGVISGAQFHFAAGGKTANAAVPAPVTSTDRDEGRWYTLPNGKVGQWSKEGWVSVQAPPKEPGKPDTGGALDHEGSDSIAEQDKDEE